MTSLFPLEIKMASCSGESVETVERRKGFSVEEQRGHFTVNFPIQGVREAFLKCKL